MLKGSLAAAEDRIQELERELFETKQRASEVAALESQLSSAIRDLKDEQRAHEVTARKLSRLREAACDAARSTQAASEALWSSASGMSVRLEHSVKVDS